MCLVVQGLLAAAAGGVNPAALQQAHWREVPHALPTITLSFVFHNVVPVIATQLEVGLLASVALWSQLGACHGFPCECAAEPCHPAECACLMGPSVSVLLSLGSWLGPDLGLALGLRLREVGTTWVLSVCLHL